MSQVRRMAYILALIIGAVCITAFVWNPPEPPKFAGLAGVDVPRNILAYNAPQDEELSDSVKRQLQAADIIARVYSSNTDNVEFTLIGGSDRSALHDPRSCLVGAGWNLEAQRDEPLPSTNIKVRACNAVGQKPGDPSYDILYVYVVNNKIITQPTQIRLAMLASALLGRVDTRVYFLRFMVPLDTDPQTAALSHARLQSFAAAMWSDLKPKIMKQ